MTKFDTPPLVFNVGDIVEEKFKQDEWAIYWVITKEYPVHYRGEDSEEILEVKGYSCFDLEDEENVLDQVVFRQSANWTYRKVT
jgi:hypothetical protein